MTSPLVPDKVLQGLKVLQVDQPPGPPVNAASTDNATPGIQGASYAGPFADPALQNVLPTPLGNATGVAGGSGSGVGVVGTSQGNDGIRGTSASSAHAGVSGNNTGGGSGVQGSSVSGSGVSGQSQTGIGVAGEGHVGGSFKAGSNPKGGGNALWVGDPNNEDALMSTSNAAGYAAVAAHNYGGGFGLYGTSDRPGGTGIYAQGFLHAAVFDGNVELNGPAHCTNTMTVDIDLILTNADCAEDFDIAASARIEQGTVMALDDGGSLRPSDQSYDKKVVGVISGAGEFRPGMILDRHESVEKRAPLALMGKVCCKVDAQYGSIEVGDLLTTSSTPGHAMKATDPARAFGAVIGKALRPLAEGEGLIPVLVALQ
jgi:hypothetical protein